jgi:hypothetical protein
MARGLDAGKYFWRSGREKCFSLDIPFNRTSGPEQFPVGPDSLHHRTSIKRLPSALGSPAFHLFEFQPARNLVRQAVRLIQQ